MANFYIGDEVKFAINLQAEGFSMDEDDFDVKIVHPRGSIEGTKAQGGSEDRKLIIFREPALDDSSSDSSSSDSSSDSSSSDEPITGTWYCIVDTTGFAKGDMKVIATAHIRDTYGSDGNRNETAVSIYGTGMNP